MSTRSLRHFVREATDGPFGSALKGDDYADEGARVVRLGNIGSAAWRDFDAAFVPLDYWRELRKHEARTGDLLVAGLGDENNPVGRACVLPDVGPALVKADCFRMRVVAELADARFLAWYLSSSAGVASAERLADGSTRKRLTLGKALSIAVPDLPCHAQAAIADYLDTETARIDSLIAKKQRMIGSLLERRAVTTALGVAGALGSSRTSVCGLPWLESIPSHWRTAKLTLVARLGSGHTPSRSHPEWWANCTIPWVTTGEVAEMRSDRLEYVSETRECISELGIANSSATVHPAGTVVLCRTASAGYSAIMAKDMATSQDFATWTCGPLLRPRYLLLCLRAMRDDLLGRLAMGSTHKTIYMPDIEAIRVPLPPAEEQDEIVEQVWQRLHRIDRIVDTTERQIGLLREHRQALITAAVTGELQVPGVAA